MSVPDLRQLAGRGPEPPPPGSAAERGSGVDLPLGRRVLIAEDNWLIANEWDVVLRQAGYQVVGLAVTADEAVEACLAERPDFVLMDIRLLGARDGIDAACEVRARFDTPSVFVTAHGDPETVRRAETARPIGWLIKPVLASELPGRLAALARSS